jgi:DNA-directed RNA polymerase subunit F
MQQMEAFVEKTEYEYVKSVIGSGYEDAVAKLAIEDKVAYRAARKNMQIHSAMVMKVAGELMSIPPMQEPVTTPLGNEERYVEGFKKCILMVAGSAVQKLMQTLSKEQEVLMNIADIAIWTYQAESVLLRVQKKIARLGEEACAVDIAICRTYFYDIADKINKAAKDAIYSFAEGDEVRMMTMGLKRFTKTEVYNHKEARQLIAQKLINDGRYNF